jgi:hypothetical protein
MVVSLLFCMTPILHDPRLCSGNPKTKCTEWHEDHTLSNYQPKLDVEAFLMKQRSRPAARICACGLWLTTITGQAVVTITGLV